MARGNARDRWGVELPYAIGSRYSLLGRDGCIAAPHLRPLCTVYVCDKCFVDIEFHQQYWELREQIAELEDKLDAV